MHFETQHVEIGQKMAEKAEIGWNCVKIAWNWMRVCVKVSSLNFSAWVHAFWYPTCWNWPKIDEIARIAWSCMRIAWNCMKECVKLCENQKTAYPCQAGSNNTSNSPNRLNKAEKSAWTHGQTDASVLYIGTCTHANIPEMSQKILEIYPGVYKITWFLIFIPSHVLQGVNFLSKFYHVLQLKIILNDTKYIYGDVENFSITI